MTIFSRESGCMCYSCLTDGAPARDKAQEEEHVCCSAWHSCLGSAEQDLWGEVLQENRIFLFLSAEAQFRQKSDGLECTHTSKWYLQTPCDIWKPQQNQDLFIMD